MSQQAQVTCFTYKAPEEILEILELDEYSSDEDDLGGIGNSDGSM